VKWSDGKRFEDKFVETLRKYGYKGSYLSKHWLKQPAFIQSFAPTSLVYISNQTDLPKIFLIDDVDISTQDTNQVSNVFYLGLSLDLLQIDVLS
jgi:glycerophosphoryl diester phosphodiesterase